MDAALARLILKQAVQTADVLARYVVVHDDDVRVELLAHLPALVQGVHIAAVGVGAHGHALISLRKVNEAFLLILQIVEMVGQHTFHVNKGLDAPAVLRPKGEV